MTMFRICVVLVCLNAVQGVCRDGWIRFHDSCYLFKEEPKENWHDAQNYCSALRTHLIEIDDEDEWKFVKQEISLFHMHKTDCFWTDGTDADAEGVWVWASSMSRIEKTFWTPGEPNAVNASSSHDEDCIDLPVWQNLAWNDENCGRQCSFICEMEDSINGGTNGIIG